MDPSTTVSITAIVVSIASLGMSTVITLRQARLSHNANQLPLALEIYRVMRTAEYSRGEELLWNELPSLEPMPLSELPKPLREALQSVGNTYQMLAYLIALDLVD